MEPERAIVRWSLIKRISFRFLFSYFVLFFLTGQEIAQIPYLYPVVQKYTELWHAVAVWLGKQVFHVPYEIALDGQGSGDTTFRWILLPCYLALAFLATVIWSVLDRRRPHYQRLHQAFRLMLRFSLGLAMIVYGISKAIPNQMPSPRLNTLLQRYGDLPPMMVLWSFMGTSPAYESFTGLAELLGGVLLLVPRTVLLGSLVCIADMTMVFVLNLCYDVPVKIMSFHYLVMGILLAAPDLRRLADLFLFNRPVAPAETPPLFARRRLDQAVQVLFFLFGVYTIVMGTIGSIERYKRQNPPPPPLYGAWSAEEITLDGKDGLLDPAGWRRVAIQKAGSVLIELTPGGRRSYALTLDQAAKRMTIEQYQRDAQGMTVMNAAGEPQKLPGRWAELSYSEPEADVLVLAGTVDGRPLHAKMRKMKFAQKRFRWIIDPTDD
jgi:uncharacterized membrane protein YphA (DoxX/SURF4 family)